MIPEIGHFALILALCVAVVQGSLPIYGAAVGSSALMSVAKPAARGMFHVTKGGLDVTDMFPEKRHYPVQNQTMTEAAIDSGLLRDLYVSLGEPLAGGAWSVRLYHKPFIDWIWGGCLIMALGGVLAMSDRRYRLAWRREESLTQATPQPIGQEIS